MNLFYEYVKMPSTEQEWINEFPCIGAWDGCHVYVLA